MRYFKQKLSIEKSNYKPSLKMTKMMYIWTRKFETEKPSFEKNYQNIVVKL